MDSSLHIPVNGKSPGKLGQLFRRCGYWFMSTLRMSGLKRTSQRPAHLNDVRKRHSSCEVERDRLKDQPFDSKEALSVLFYRLSGVHEQGR